MKEHEPLPSFRHTLKTHPAQFRAVRDGRKNFEVRKDDCGFQAGDIVRLTYHDPEASPFAAPPGIPDFGDNLEPIERRVTYVLRGGQYGVEPNYVVLSLEPVE